MEPSRWLYLVGFLVPASIGVVIGPPLARFAIRHRIVDGPGGRKEQEAPVPYLGGLAIFMSFALAIVPAGLISISSEIVGEFGFVLGAGLFLAAVGLLDDIREVDPMLRIAAEALVGGVLWWLGFGVELTGLSWLDLVLTTLWVVGMVNAVNMVDNMDGLAAGLVVSSSLSVFVLTVLNGQTLVSTMAIALCGSAVGFLFHNYFPARIYMGDSGAYFMGFLLAYVGIKIRFVDAPRSVSYLLTLLAFSVLIFEIVFVTIVRIRNRINPFRGGRDHVSHRLVRLGLHPRVAVLLIHFISVVWSVIAYLVSGLGGEWIVVATITCVAFFVVFGTFLARVKVYT